MTAIALEQVGKRYGDGPGAVTALADVTLQVEPGDFLSVMGPSGSGKSTLLHLVAGLDTPSSGRVVVSGAELTCLSDDTRSDLRLRHIGLVFQTFNLFPALTVEENVAWPLAFAAVGWRRARARAVAVLMQLGIDRRACARKPAELSGGEQQRVALARALINEPNLLLADEPTGNLDSRTARDILDLLSWLNATRELTVVLVTHDPLVARYAHRMIELRDGRVARETGRAGRRARPRLVVDHA